MRLWQTGIVVAVWISLGVGAVWAEADPCDEKRYVCRENGGLVGVLAGLARDCKQLRKCKKGCRGAKRSCMKKCRKQNDAVKQCKASCKRKYKGKKRRTCKRNCRKKKRDCKKSCRSAKRSCKKSCRSKYGSRCRRAGMEVLKHVVKAANCTAAFVGQNYYKAGQCVAKRGKQWAICFKLADQCRKQRN